MVSLQRSFLYSFKWFYVTDDIMIASESFTDLEKHPKVWKTHPKE